MKTIITEYGKSFYGGWYANFKIVRDYKTQYDGIHADTLGELKRIMKDKFNIDYEGYVGKRIDHI